MNLRSVAAARYYSFRLRWATLVVSALAGLIISGWFWREPLLRCAAYLWIVSDPITRADAVVVLGGNFHVRPSVAADLYSRGLADRILISQMAEGNEGALRASPSDTELSRGALSKLGVPPDHIKNFGTANTNTRDEAVALREWAKKNAASVVIVPTEIFHARRVRWIFQRELSGSGVRIQVLSFDPPEYTRNAWWKKEQGIIAFQNEVLKYLYYRIKY